MGYVEIGNLEIESQGPFAPERLAGDVYSRRFYSATSLTVITVYVAAVSDLPGRFYPESISEVAKDEHDPLDVSGDFSDYEYDSDISYTDFDSSGEATAFARNWVESLSPDHFS